jgi:ferredoxin-thioredoxin reductase catalytic chain
MMRTNFERCSAMTSEKATDEKAGALYRRLKEEAEASGYLLNPDEDFVMDLMVGLVTNEERYGYISCPCRDADGVREKDRDIICPCNYRDPDLAEFGMCYCALYVSDEVARGERKLGPIPERRGQETPKPASNGSAGLGGKSGEPIWRCDVCGYLCARPEPPLKCPICKADKDRFGTLQSEPLWKCTVCGYLCARSEPPLKCPVCKADKDRFDRFG